METKIVRIRKKPSSKTSMQFAMKNIANVLSFVLFFGLLITLSLTTLISRKEQKSELENRNLAVMPKFSVNTVLNRKFMDGTETFLADHFAYRTKWVAAETAGELLQGRREINGVYFLKASGSQYDSAGPGLAEMVEAPNPQTLEKNIASLQSFAENAGRPVYLMLAPTAADIYRNQMPDNAPNPDQKGLIESIYQRLPGLTPLDVYNVLYTQRNEYIYYRTDHHWTTLGAYYAYEACAKKLLGSNPVPMDAFDIEHVTDSFLGTLYSKVLYNDITPDTISLWSYDGGATVTRMDVRETLDKTVSYDSIYRREYLDVKDKYSVFCGNNQPIVSIYTDASLSRSNDRKLLVIKDSYAHSMAPFLAEHYSEVTMTDLRYINVPLQEVMDISQYDQILLLYNFSTFSNYEHFWKLKIS